MSRIGNRILLVPEGVTVTIDGTHVTVKGPKGELSREFSRRMDISIEGNEITTKRLDEIKTTRQLHGTTNSLIFNMIEGVKNGYSKQLEIIGVGYRFKISGKKITINAGFSHPVEMIVPEGITVEGISNTVIKISGINKQEVGEFAAVVRKVKEPEPYKGKGIRYSDEQVRRKEGKKAA